MQFSEALELMRHDGLKVKRPMWTNAYLFIGKDCSGSEIVEGLYLGRFGSSKVYKIQNVTASNILSSDWEVCIDPYRAEAIEKINKRLKELEEMDLDELQAQLNALTEE